MSNEFSTTLQHHLNQTRAGKFGQFEHAWNQRPGGDSAFNLLPGQSILFEGETIEGQVCSLLLENNLSGLSGSGYAGYLNPISGRTVVIPVDPQPGDATLTFSCPTSTGAGEVLSYCTNTFQTSRDRWESIDAADTVIFSVNAQTTRNIVRADSGGSEGSWFVTGDSVPFAPFFGGLAEFGSDGLFVWRGRNDAGRFHDLAYDPVNDYIIVTEDRSGPDGGSFVVAYDSASHAHKGGSGEESPVWSFKVHTQALANVRIHDVKVAGGFVYVAARSTDRYDGATTSVFKDTFKLDASDGTLLATYHVFDAGDKELSIDSGGNVFLVQNSLTNGEEGGPDAANIRKFDSDLVLLARAELDWLTKVGTNFPRSTKLAIDDNDKVYVVTGGGFLVRLDNDLTIEEKSLSLFSPAFSDSDHIKAIGHNQAGKLILFGGGEEFSFRATIVKFDNDGNELSRFLPATPASDVVDGAGYVSPAVGGGPGPDLGTLFTQELSSNPPGKIQAIAAVKFDAQSLVSVFWNSVDVEFDHSKWKATHSVAGPIDVTPQGQWEYNSPL